MLKRWIWGAVVVLAVSALGVWYWWDSRTERAYVGPIEELTLAAYTGDTAALVWVAEELNYFQKHGLDVTIKEYSAGKLAADAVSTGNADVATCAGFVLVKKSFRESDLRVLGTVATADTNKFIGRKDRGISAPSDVKGKTIGTTRGSSGEFFLGRFLEINGLEFSDVNIVDMAPPELVEAVTAGEIDGTVTWEPNVFNAKNRLGNNAVAFSAQGGQDLYFIVIAKESWINAHRQGVERLLSALKEAERFVAENSSEARDIIERRFGYAPKFSSHNWNNHQFKVRMPQALLTSFEDQARWLIDIGHADGATVPNYLQFLYLDGLTAVSVNSVTVIQ